MKQIRREHAIAVKCSPVQNITARVSSPFLTYDTLVTAKTSLVSMLCCILALMVSAPHALAAAPAMPPQASVAKHVILPSFTPIAHATVRPSIPGTKYVRSGANGGAIQQSVRHQKNAKSNSSAFDLTIRPLIEARAKQQAASAATSMAQTALPQGQPSGITPTQNFGGFLAAPSYQAIPFPVTNDNSTFITLTADFNKDGASDIATLDFNGNINVLLNDGKGHFAAPVTSSGATLVQSPVHFIGAVAADVDGDGYPDIIAKQWRLQKLFIFHNNHDGTFATPTVLPVLLSSQEDVGSFLVGDVNGDGIPDIVSMASVYDPNANVSTITIQTFPGLGNGTFSTSKVVTSVLTYANYNLGLPNNGAMLQMMAGKLNLVFEGQAYDDANTGFLIGASVIALPSNGDGSFVTTPYSEVDITASYGEITDNSGGLSLADLNGDGIPDITMNFNDDYIYTALGHADGTFAAPQVADTTFAINPSGWAVLDLNGDGYPDFIDYDSYFTAIFLGNGDGTFAAPKIVYSTGESPTTGAQNSPGSNLVVADFNKDGTPDFAVVDAGSVSYDRASIFIGHGDGSFIGIPAVAPVNDPNTFPQGLDAYAALDLNGDGKQDVLLQSSMGSGPYPYISALSNGKGNFTYKQALAGGAGGFETQEVSTATGDFNGDGLQDVLFSGESASGKHVLAVSLSNGDGTLQAPVALNMGTTAFAFTLTGMSIGDVNGDGKLDIIATYQSISTAVPSGFVVILGNGDGTFQPATFTVFGTSLYSSALADFNGDGKLDLVLSDTGSSSAAAKVSIIYGDGSGIFNAANAQTIQTGNVIISLLPGDVNQDGKLDLVMLSEGLRTSTGLQSSGEGAQVYINNGTGGFTPGSIYEAGRNPAQGSLADFNGDGVPDLFFSEYPATDATPTYYGSQLLLGKGDGTFGAPIETQIPPASSILLPGDYLQDGALDLVAESEYGAVALLLNQGGTAITLTPSSPTVTVGSNETITAYVLASMEFRPDPQGAITFTENGAVIGSTDISAGSGTLTTSSLPVGSHKLIATYSGDANFNPNVNAGTVSYTVVAAPVIAPSFTMSSSTTTLPSITIGQTGTATVTVTANSTYVGSIGFAVLGPENGLQVQVNPVRVSLTAGQSTTVMVSVSAVSSSSAKDIPTLWKRSSGGLALACLFGLILPFRRKRLGKLLTLIVVCGVSLVGAAGLSGCSNNNTGTTRGTSTLVITATPSVQGVAVQAVNLSITVN